MKRVAVIGTSCAGKTTLASRLARLLGAVHVELDALNWGPGWTESTPEVLRASVASAVEGDRWVIDGNYRVVQDIVWPRADTVIWLNYAFPLVFRRALLRTVRRILRRERLFGENVETLGSAFLSLDGIPWWVIRTHGPRRRSTRKLLAAPAHRHLTIVECRRPREAEAVLRAVAHAETRPASGCERPVERSSRKPVSA